MPYTPPSQQSPATSKSTSPALSRAQSYSADLTAQQSPAQSRPSLPRSVSSAAYLNKQRRGPSVSQVDSSSLPHSPLEDEKAGATLSSNGSIRQSPPPVNNLLIPTGAILSPPDSSENSDGDDASEPARGRDYGRSWNDLEQAVRSIEQRREHSPARNERVAFSTEQQTSSEPTTTVHSPTALSASARKISHSRSSTETAIVIPERNAYSDASPTSEDSDEDDEDSELRMKPPLVRKKSGELVKPALRPSSRRRYSSMPGTPTYSKSVHFNDNGNQTRHFLQVDKPSAVSAGSSPVETYESETEYPFENKVSNKLEWDIRLANFPENSFERTSLPVRVERLHLSADTQTLVGTIAVMNISFQKFVAARFTLDYWKTTSEVCAEYDNDVRRQNPSDGCDRFTFSIRLADQANLENKTLLLCIRYNVGGQEHWDNNNGMNYQIDFLKKMVKSASTSSLALPSSNSSSSTRPRGSIPRSRHAPPTAVARERTPSTDDDLHTRFDVSSAYHFGSPEKLIGDAPHTSVKLRPRTKRTDLFRAGSAPSTNGLGGRYDFGASLSAALSNAQDKLGKQSGLMSHAHSMPRSNANYFSREVQKEVKSTAGEERPDVITTDRPAMGSEQYRDLVQKFCYFTPGGTGKVSPQNTVPGSNTTSTDGSMENSESPSPCSSNGSSTPTQSMSPLLDGTNERKVLSGNASPLTSRSASPSPMAGSLYSSRTASPMSFGYPYHHQNSRDGYLSVSPARTAIRG